MKKNGLLSKIDAVYTKVTKKIIGEIPPDTEDNTVIPHSPIESIKTFTQKSIHKIKTVGLKKAILTAGTPDEKEVLYKEVVKKEKQEIQEAKRIERERKKTLKEAEKALKEKKKKTVLPKKKPTKAPSTKKTTAKTNDNEEKKTTAKTAKKTVAKKTVTKKPTTKSTAKETKKTDTKSTSKKNVAKKPLPKTTQKRDAKETASGTKKKVSTKTKTTAKKTTAVTTKTDTPKTKVSTKKTATKKETPTKTITSKKASSQPKGSKRAEKIALYIKDIKKHYGEVDEDFVAIIVKNLGPSIYKRDAETVACSDPKELDTVRRNFLVKKLGIDASRGVLDAAIQDVCAELKGVRTKYRATFYYALAKKFKKESVLS